MPYKDPQAKIANDRDYYIANKERIRARQSAYRLNHLDDERKRHAEFCKNNHDKVRAYKGKYKKSNPDKVKAQAKKERDNLSDYYVRKKIAQVYSIPTSQIPQTLVDTHRELLKLKRELRNEKL